MPKPANPSIIIGMGGTGQWVLTYVKKNLIDTYGEVPPTVKLIAFDTTSEETEAKLEKSEEHAKVGNIKLDITKGEFVYLGGNIRELCKTLLTDKQSNNHIRSWLQYEYYLATLSDDDFHLFKGAGQRRPFGRMAVFYDMKKSQPDIYGKIETALSDVMKHNEKRTPVEIYMVCSLAGGTGSGMFIDMAHIARKLAERAQISFAIRAFLVLQNTFQPVMEVDKILANSFAAMRELDRFLLVFDRDYPIPYIDDHTNRTPLDVYRSIYRSKLFDNCYLLDARRRNNPLDQAKPWLGMFPSVAECITALLDSETGDTFAQHYRNVNGRLAQRQKESGKALYSSLGTYTYVLPVEDMIDTAVHKAAIELLRDRLLITAGDQREFKNNPQEAVKTFFRSSKTPGGTDNLGFLNQMIQTLEGGNLDDTEYIQSMTQRGVEYLSWLEPADKDDSVNMVSKNIQSILEASLVNSVANSDVYKDTYRAASDRIIREINTFRDGKLGYEEAGARRVPGELQKGLADYARRNRSRFRLILAEWMNMLLNGENSDPVIAKSGKLPYTQEFLKWMVKYFDEFDTFMKRVWDARSRSGELSIARDDAIRTRQIMEATKHLDGFLDKLKKTAVHAQNDYIQAEDYLFYLEREDVLIQAIMDYTVMLRNIAQDAKAQIDRWVQVLSTGGEMGNNEEGAIKVLTHREADLKRQRNEQEKILVYEYLTDDNYENELYERLIANRWGEIMRRFDWKISFRHSEMDKDEPREEGQVRYYYKWEKENKPDFTVKFFYEGEALKDTETQGQPASVDNTLFLIKVLRPYFVDIRQESIADRLQEQFRADKAAKAMLDHTDPLLSFDQTNQPFLERHNYVCVNQGNQVEYFNEITRSLKDQAPRDQDNQVIGLTNKHRCVVFSTQDLIIGQETDPIITSRKAYMDHTGDHRLLHNFPAEVNASDYENRLTQRPINESRRVLSPTLVALLEDKEMARRFILGRVFGLIREEAVPGQTGKSQWVLTVDRENERDTSYRICLTNPEENPKELDAMTEFVFVKIDKDTSARYVRDVTQGKNLLLPPDCVDKAIDIRQKSILSGRELLVAEFDKLLQQRSPLLSPEKSDARTVLVNAFRRFIMTEFERYNREILLGNTGDLANFIQEFFLANTDCLSIDLGDPQQEKKFSETLAADTVKMLQEKAGEVKPEPVKTLVRSLEKHIKQHVLPMRSSQDTLTHDLGSVMHRILWDEVERLERLGSTLQS